VLSKLNSHLSIGARLSLMSALFVVGSGVGVATLASNSLGQIGFSEKEREGTAYLRELFAGWQSGNVNVGNAELNERFNAADEFSVFAGSEEGAERDAAALALLAAVADGSNLTLDPELASYNLQDAISIRIPKMIAGEGLVDAAVQATGDPQRPFRLYHALAGLESVTDDATGAIGRAIENDATGLTEDKLGRLREGLGRVGKAMVDEERAAIGGGASIASSTTEADFPRVTGEVWNAVADGLDQLLKRRIDSLYMTLWMQLALVGVLMGAAGALAFAVSRGLGSRFRALGVAMDELGAGNDNVDIPFTTDRHETGKIAATLARFKEGLIQRKRDAEQRERDKAEADAARAAAMVRAQKESEELVVHTFGEGLSRLATGDLTFRLTGEVPAAYRKLQNDFNDAIGKLQETMRTIVVNGGSIRTGAGEISHAADDLSRRTEQQAASLEETAAALDEITATVRKTAEGARQANSVVAATRSDAEQSGQVVRETVAAMAEIEKSSKQISQIIGVIDEIAFQTNLLALNAGVEAARAGEAGRGFAVVASEVRALAQRSSEAAKEIKGLISASSQHVETGVDLVGQAGKALQQIMGKVSEISGLVGEIAASAQEQSTALVEVNTAINQMDQVTQQNAAMVEESTAASHSLTQEASELMGLIANFQTGVPVETASKPARSRPPGMPVHQQRQRAQQFITHGSAAVKSDDDWQEF
jgi:methyl-accepting chemotaxis protein